MLACRPDARYLRPHRGPGPTYVPYTVETRPTPTGADRAHNDPAALTASVPVHVCPPTTIAGTTDTPSSRARAPAASRASETPRLSTLARTARGCSSHAAAAISTLSMSPRERPARNACRIAASENATARPVCFA